MSCTSKLQQKYLERDRRNEWPDDWQNQFIKLKRVWSNKIKTTQSVRLSHPIYINTFEKQILSDCDYDINESDDTTSYEEKTHKERINKINKKTSTTCPKNVVNEIPYFIQILRQLHDKISNLLEMSDDELCRNIYEENRLIQKRKRRPKRKYKLRERYYQSETCSIKSTSPERDFETESIISSDDYTNYKSVEHKEEMKLSILHNMPENNSQIQDDQKYSIKINYVDRTYSKYNRQRVPYKKNQFSGTVDDVNQVSSNCLLIPLISNVKRSETDSQ